MTDVSSGEVLGGSNGRTSEGRTEVTQELMSLKREVIESRNLAIKTENLLKVFHSELKAISKKQEGYERKHFLGHVAAYVVIGLLAAGGSVLALSLAVASSEQEAERKLADAREAVARAETAEKQATTTLAARDAVAADAKAAFKLLQSKSRKDQERGLEQVGMLDLNALDELARSLIQRESAALRENFASEAYQAGMNLYHRTRLREATVELEKYLTFAQPLGAEWQASERALAAYYLGAAYNQMGQHEAAANRLKMYLDSGATGDTAAYASLMMGDSLQILGKKAEAKRAFEHGLKVGRGTRSSSLRQRLQALNES